MALRPVAVSVVLAAALLGTTVLHDGGAGVLDGPIADASPSTAQAGSSPGAAGPSSSPGPVQKPDGGAPAPSTPSGGTGGSGETVRLPVTAAQRFGVWRHGPRTSKLIALTFDDGWNLEYTKQIFEILEARDAPATFFPVARAVLRHPVTWRRIAAAGFPIANHSWNHDDLSLQSPSKAGRDMTKATRAIERTTGAPLFPAIRPPFGTYDATFMKAAKAAGMRAVIMWDIDTEDWRGIRARDVVRAALKGRRGSIIVMHTDKANTVRALPKIIDGLRARGFTLVTVGQLIGLPGSVPVFMDRDLRDFQRGH